MNAVAQILAAAVLVAPGAPLNPPVPVVVAPPIGDTSSGFMTGAQLYGLCQDSRPSVAPDACTAYVGGVFDALARSGSPAPYCLPSGFRSGQVAGIVRRYLISHPTSLGRPAPAVIGTAWAEAFPCPLR